MSKTTWKRLVALCVLASLLAFSLSCASLSQSGDYFGKNQPPAKNIFRYVTGDEPQSLDPPISLGQPEARIYMALYDGLVEYNPKDLSPMPSLAERWDINNDSSEFTFHLRQNGRFSNGDPIDANDFVYTFRRAVSPELASGNAYLAYYIKYAQQYNEKKVFVRDPATNQFLLAKDFGDDTPEPLSSQPVAETNEYSPTQAEPKPDADSEFHHLMHSPQRLTLPGSEKARNKLLDSNAQLKAAVAGKELVSIKGEDIGIEAVDKYVVRISLAQPGPFFLGLLAHQLFRLVHRKTVETYGEQWTDPKHIVTCGPFKLKTWEPYNKLVVERDPMFWDAATVKLDEIHFYPMADNPSIMNLYKVGDIDAVLNHTVPNAWLDVVRNKKDYMDGKEAGIDYLQINVTQPPMNDVRVRKAFNYAIDKNAWATFKQIVKPLTAFTPEGIFPDYPQPKGDEFNPERARQLLGEAGFPVTKNADGSFSCPKFPVKDLEYIYNTQESNKTMAEWMQAQWKQNLGITIGLRNMESKTFLAVRTKLDYKGFSRGGWSADYMDPFTFLSLFYTGGDSGTGWQDPNYIKMLDVANRTLDQKKRYELLAQAEKYLIDAQPVIPIDTPSVNWVKKPYVKGMYPNPGTLFPWKFVYIERDQAKWDSGTPSLQQQTQVAER
ncbi:MAG TPA: peptide ABC transporter substrate-binding protein [Pyrinomonadaceae bacterium]